MNHGEESVSTNITGGQTNQKRIWLMIKSRRSRQNEDENPQRSDAATEARGIEARDINTRRRTEPKETAHMQRGQTQAQKSVKTSKTQRCCRSAGMRRLRMKPLSVSTCQQKSLRFAINCMVKDAAKNGNADGRR